MAKQTKKKTQRKNTKNTNPFLSIEAVAVFIIVYSLLATFQLGFLGKFFANLIRFFIGDLYASVECAEFLRGSGCYSVDACLRLCGDGLLQPFHQAWHFSYSCQ